MSAIQSLLMVLQSAVKDRDEAVSALEVGRRAHEAAQQQGQSLVDWRREHEQRWQTQFRQTGGMEIMRCYQDFMQRLTDAVNDQDKRVAQAHLHMEKLRAELIERERKVAAVTQLIERRRAESRIKHNRREQKATDEMAARSANGAHGLGGDGSPMASRAI